MSSIAVESFGLVRPRKFCWISAVAGVMIVSIVCPLATAQIARSQPPLLIAQATRSTVVLYVNPVTGTDAGDGSDRAPLKTIRRALDVAPSGAVIQLAPGTYSTETGEAFPLRLRSGITVQGDPQTRGQGIVIRGSGVFLSPSSARQMVTLIGANQAGLVGVTVTNPEARGYGVWVEGTSPIVSDSTFSDNGHDGISVVGNGAPVIRNNYFYKNGANGITVYGSSRPEVRENIFEQTGFAININQTAAPLIVGNRITQNRDGVIVQAKAAPILRNNSIEGNERDGLVAIAESRPDLGTAAEPGGNLFRNNGQFDVNTKASSQTIPALGNEMSKTAGQLDLTGATPVAASPSLSTSPAPRLVQPIDSVAAPLPTAPTIAFGQQLSPPAAEPRRSLLPPSTPATKANSDISAASFPSPRVLTSTAKTANPTPALPVSPPVRLQPSPRSVPLPRLVPIAASVAPAQLRPVSPPRSLPVPTRPTPLPTAQFAASRTTSSRLPLKIPTATTPIAIQVPEPETGSAAPPEPKPLAIAAAGQTPNLLPVPSPNVPLGNVGGNSSVYRSAQRSASTAESSSLRYRVVVDATDSSQQDQVRAIAPTAFRTYLKGRMVFQVGAFGDRAKADELVQTLTGRGINATVEQLE